MTELECENRLDFGTKTWNKDSNELFDYENTTPSIVNYETNSRKLIFRKHKSDDLIVVGPNKEKVTNSELIAKIDNDQDNFYILANLSKSFKRSKVDYDVQKDNSILTPNFDLAQNNMWFVIKKFNSKYIMGQDEDKIEADAGEYVVETGDIIKIGRLKLKVSEFKLENDVEKCLKLDNEQQRLNSNNRNNINSNLNANVNTSPIRRRETNFNINVNDNDLDNEPENEFNYIETVSVNQGENNNINNVVNPFTSVSNNNHVGNFFSNLNNNNVDDQINTEMKDCKENKRISKKTCRICYCTEEEIDCPLIQPCDCSGSMRYIHFSCLQSWLKTRSTNLKQYHSTTVSAYFIKKNFDCELCKKNIPDVIKQKNQVFNILDFLKSDYKSYIILESYLTSVDKRNYPTARQFYTLKLEGKSNFKIGRGHESDLRLNDISISRIHAQFNLRYNKLKEKSYLTVSDCESKFGTLSYCFNPRILVVKGLPLTIQIGRSLLNFRVVKPVQLLRCLVNCFLCKKAKVISKKKYNNYQEQNSYALEKLNEKHYRRIKSISFNDETEDEQSRVKNMGNTELNSNVNAININVNYNSQNFNSNALLNNELKTKDINYVKGNPDHNDVNIEGDELINLDDFNEDERRYNQNYSNEIIQVYAKPIIKSTNNNIIPEIKQNSNSSKSNLDKIDDNLIDYKNENNENKSKSNISNKENDSIVLVKKVKCLKKAKTFTFKNNACLAKNEMQLKLNFSFSFFCKNSLLGNTTSNDYVKNNKVSDTVVRRSSYNATKHYLTQKSLHNDKDNTSNPNIPSLIFNEIAINKEVLKIEAIDENNSEHGNNKIYSKELTEENKKADINNSNINKDSNNISVLVRSLTVKKNQTKKFGSHSQQKVNNNIKIKSKSKSGKSNKKNKAKIINNSNSTEKNLKDKFNNFTATTIKQDYNTQEYLAYFPQSRLLKSSSNDKSNEEIVKKPKRINKLKEQKEQNEQKDYNDLEDTSKIINLNKNASSKIECNLNIIDESALMKELKSDSEVLIEQREIYEINDINNFNRRNFSLQVNHDKEVIESLNKINLVKKSSSMSVKNLGEVKIKKANVESDQTLPLNTSIVREVNFNDNTKK